MKLKNKKLVMKKMEVKCVLCGREFETKAELGAHYAFSHPGFQPNWVK